MMGMFLFGLQYELTMNHARRFPEKYGLTEKNLKEGKITTMPIHHRALNFLVSILLSSLSLLLLLIITLSLLIFHCNPLIITINKYDNPFSFILCTGVPFAATIFKQQMQYSHLKFSQRVMHTRVFAQAGIITIAMTTMAFREFMDRRGRFPEPSSSS